MTPHFHASSIVCVRHCSLSLEKKNGLFYFILFTLSKYMISVEFFEHFNFLNVVAVAGFIV